MINYYNRRVFEELYLLPKSIKARYLALLDKMIIYGPNLGMAYTQAMGDKLFELRVKSIEGHVRVFYCTQEKQKIVMLHSFMKKTQITPQYAQAVGYDIKISFIKKNKLQ